MMPNQLTQQQLEIHLWRAADILRGAIDASDYKNYIFALLFYKRLCDIWEEEHEKRVQVCQGQSVITEPGAPRFVIPEGSTWRDVRAKNTKIGKMLNSAFHQIEYANPRLRGVFQDVDFNNKERFSDATLEKLLKHFEIFRLRTTDCEADMLGNAYEYLIAQFADDAGKKGGEFYTPKMVVRTIVECLKPQEGMSIYDPTCGSGGMLMECSHYLHRTGKDPTTLLLYGQERNLQTWAISVMNLFLHDIDTFFLERGDTLLNPKHRQKGSPNKLMQFDRVLANPPFSLKRWGYEKWQDGDRYGRDIYGSPPPSYGDLAFVQHMLATLKPGGLLGVVLPHGILFRGGAEGKIRKGMLQDDIVEAVIGLAPNLFYGTGIPACILIINKGKSDEKKGKVLFIHGVNVMTPGKNQNCLSEQDVARLVQAFHAHQDEERFSRVVTLQEIAEYDYNLNISRYVQIGEEEEEIDVVVEVAKLQVLQEVRGDAEVQMMVYLKEIGYGG